jgi:hypothetical protein
MVASWQVLPSLLLLMLSSQQALFPTFQLLLLLPSADLFQLYLTSPVLAVNSLEVFTDLLHRVSHSIGFYRHFCFFFVLLFFAGFCFHFPTLFGNPLGRGSGEKMSFFQIVHTTKVSSQIHSSISQYDGYKVLSKK